MSCEEFDLDELVFGGLSGESADQLRVHLVRCAACRDEYDRLVVERRMFGARSRMRSAEEGSVPDFDSIMSQAPAVALPPERGVRALVGQITVAAAALVLLAAGIRHQALPSAGGEASAAPQRAERGATVTKASVPTDDSESDPCAVEEPVCREGATATAVRFDRTARQSIVAVPRANIDCPPAQTSMPGTLDSLVGGIEASCVPETI